MATIKTKISIFIFGIVVFFASCLDQNSVYYQYVSIDPSGWHKDSIVTFDANITDTTSYYNVIIEIRHRNEYPYQNLYLFVNSLSPDSISVGDTLNCILADVQGRWYGSGIGSNKNLPILYMPEIKFPQEGVYIFNVQQGMREEILEGVSDIGLKVEKAN